MYLIANGAERQRCQMGAARVTLSMIVGLMWVGYFTGAGDFGSIFSKRRWLVCPWAEPRVGWRLATGSFGWCSEPWSRVSSLGGAGEGGCGWIRVHPSGSFPGGFLPKIYNDKLRHFGGDLSTSGML